MSACPESNDVPHDEPEDVAAPVAGDHVPHRPPLCVDLPIGRVVRAVWWVLPVYLSLDIELVTRNLKYYKYTKGTGPVLATIGERQIAVTGLVDVLSIQVRVRPLTPDRKPKRYITGFDVFGDPDGPWPLTRFEPALGIDVADLSRLAELSREYNRNLIGAEPHTGAPPTVALIPSEIQRELREIAARLNDAPRLPYLPH